MFDKIFDDSKVVVFDEKGNIVESGKDQQQNQKMEKDPNATAMFETHEFAGGRVKSVWHAMLTNRQRTLLFGLFLLLFVGLAVLVKHQVKLSNQKYNEAVQSRMKRGCKYPTMVIHGPKEGYAVDPDEGCSPK